MQTVQSNNSILVTFRCLYCQNFLGPRGPRSLAALTSANNIIRNSIRNQRRKLFSLIPFWNLIKNIWKMYPSSYRLKLELLPGLGKTRPRWQPDRSRIEFNFLDSWLENITSSTGEGGKYLEYCSSWNSGTQMKLHTRISSCVQ